MNPFEDLARDMLDRPGMPVSGRPGRPSASPLLAPKERKRQPAKPPGASFGVKKERLTRFPCIPTPWDLSPAQCAVVALIPEDMTAVEIGLRLHMSHKTVASHIGRIKAAMGVRTMVQAAILWDRLQRPGGSIPEPDEGLLVIRWRGGQYTVDTNKQGGAT